MRQNIWHGTNRALRRAVLPLALLAAFPVEGSAQENHALASVEIVGMAPLAGLAISKDEVPANVRTVGSRQLNSASTLTDVLAGQIGSVQVNETQGNPFQPDVQFRGFTASPLLGTPQGISVFVDGVRMNAPFGDVVNWDLIPKNAIGKTTLIPGSNPVFGLNTLGGALSLQTKNGRSDAGTELSLTSGSFGRHEAAFEYGGFKDELDWFFSGLLYRDRGWRDMSPSNVRQLFGKLRHRDRNGEIAVSLATSDNSLNGNGLAPESLLRTDRKAAYTLFDNTDNRSWLANLSYLRAVGNDKEITANLYARRIRTRTINSDINQIADARYGVQPFDDDPQPGLNEASVNRSRLDQDSTGFTLQANLGLDGAAVNKLSAGLALDDAKTWFSRSYQLAAFNPDRSATATGIETDINNLSGRVRAWGLYATDTLRVSERAHVTFSGRYNLVQVATRDRLDVPLLNANTPGVNDPNFNSDYTYRSFNPALGLNWKINRSSIWYAGFNAGSRVPSPIELACADPNNACLLPNQMASDPYLKQVRTHTVETGARGKLDNGWSWSAAAYRSDNADDILFVSTSSGGAGYFTNFGKTRRQGVELALSGKTGNWRWAADYALTDATYQSDAIIQSPNNSTRGDMKGNGASDDQIRIRPGNHLPGVARNALKLSLDYAANDRWSVGGQLLAYSWQYARGNENNLHQAGTATSNLGNTRTFDGAGAIPGYAIVNLQAKYRLRPNIEPFLHIDNLFDRRYATAGLLGENAFAQGTFDTTGNWRAESFYAPGAPRAFWIGVRFTLD